MESFDGSLHHGPSLVVQIVGAVIQGKMIIHENDHLSTFVGFVH
jgi:hypothetical protein